MNKKIKDETGKRYGRLLVESLAGVHPTRRTARWNCLCDCGAHSIVSGVSLRVGHSSSCGCFHKDVIGAINRTHNKSHQKWRTNPVYAVWHSMRQRCFNPNNPSYHNYGGRGISVCERWDSYEVFELDMGPRPQNTSLDRIDNNDGYYPENCRWATRAEQNSNKRDSTSVQYRGKTYTLMQLSNLLEMQFNTLRYRVTAGWPEDLWGAPPGSTGRGKTP